MSAFLYAQSQLPTEFGMMEFRVYRAQDSEIESVAISRGIEDTSASHFVRIHSQCFTSEIFGSLKCDCKEQLNMALSRVGKEGGVVVYLPQEGRGIGLGNKIRAYAKQDEGADTVEANHLIGLPTDLRDFTMAVEILKDLRVERIQLNTNNPEKVTTVRNGGIEITQIIPSVPTVNPHNADYLATKLTKLGHEALRDLLNPPKKPH